MSETIHPAQALREAEIALNVASQQSADLERTRWPWQRLSLRRCATLSGILSLLEGATETCRAAGADPRSPLATAIRDLIARLRSQRRKLLAAYGIIVVATLVVGAIVCAKVWMTPIGASPIIADPKAGAAVAMTISVSGLSPRGSLPPGTNLYILVKPLNLDYWVQLPPDALPPELNRTGWRAAKIGIGQNGDVGMYFRICAILTGQTLLLGWHASDLPPGDAHCIDVTRK